MNLAKSSRKDLREKENTAPSNVQAEESSITCLSIRNKKPFQ